MATKLCRVIATLVIIATIVQAIEVNVTSEWKPEFGWEVTCTWETPPNDTLQSVRLYNNGQQFMIYRPEKHGRGHSEIFRSPNKIIRVDCASITYRGQEGQCILLLEPYQPPTGNFSYACEVSGERPLFKIEKKDYVIKVLVPPSDATLLSTTHEDASSNRVMLNCSSNGLPAPTLQWTVANDKVQADFSGRFWNATSKLWHVWSYLSYTRNEDSRVICSPEVNYNNEIVTGKPAEYNSAIKLLGTGKLTLMTLAVSLLR